MFALFIVPCTATQRTRVWQSKMSGVYASPNAGQYDINRDAPAPPDYWHAHFGFAANDFQPPKCHANLNDHGHTAGVKYVKAYELNQGDKEMYQVRHESFQICESLFNDGNMFALEHKEKTFAMPWSDPLIPTENAPFHTLEPIERWCLDEYRDTPNLYGVFSLKTRCSGWYEDTSSRSGSFEYEVRYRDYMNVQRIISCPENNYNHGRKINNPSPIRVMCWPLKQPCGKLLDGWNEELVKVRGHGQNQNMQGFDFGHLQSKMHWPDRIATQTGFTPTTNYMPGLSRLMVNSQDGQHAYFPKGDTLNKVIHPDTNGNLCGVCIRSCRVFEWKTDIGDWGDTHSSRSRSTMYTDFDEIPQFAATDSLNAKDVIETLQGWLQSGKTLVAYNPRSMGHTCEGSGHVQLPEYMRNMVGYCQEVSHATYLYRRPLTGIPDKPSEWDAGKFVDYQKVAGGFVVGASGTECPSGKEITSAADCRAAATQLGMPPRIQDEHADQFLKDSYWNPAHPIGCNTDYATLVFNNGAHGGNGRPGHVPICKGSEYEVIASHYPPDKSDWLTETDPSRVTISASWLDHCSLLCDATSECIAFTIDSVMPDYTVDRNGVSTPGKLGVDYPIVKGSVGCRNGAAAHIQCHQLNGYPADRGYAGILSANVETLTTHWPSYGCHLLRGQTNFCPEASFGYGMEVVHYAPNPTCTSGNTIYNRGGAFNRYVQNGVYLPSAVIASEFSIAQRPTTELSLTQTLKDGFSANLLELSGVQIPDENNMVHRCAFLCRWYAAGECGYFSYDYHGSSSPGNCVFYKRQAYDTSSMIRQLTHPHHGTARIFKLNTAMNENDVLYSISSLVDGEEEDVDFVKFLASVPGMQDGMYAEGQPTETRTFQKNAHALQQCFQFCLSKYASKCNAFTLELVDQSNTKCHLFLKRQETTTATHFDANKFNFEVEHPAYHMDIRISIFECIPPCRANTKSTILHTTASTNLWPILPPKHEMLSGCAHACFNSAHGDCIGFSIKEDRLKPECFMHFATTSPTYEIQSAPVGPGIPATWTYQLRRYTDTFFQYVGIPSKICTGTSFLSDFFEVNGRDTVHECEQACLAHSTSNKPECGGFAVGVDTNKKIRCATFFSCPVSLQPGSLMDPPSGSVPQSMTFRFYALMDRISVFVRVSSRSVNCAKKPMLKIVKDHMWTSGRLAHKSLLKRCAELCQQNMAPVHREHSGCVGFTVTYDSTCSIYSTCDVQDWTPTPIGSDFAVSYALGTPAGG